MFFATRDGNVEIVGGYFMENSRANKEPSVTENIRSSSYRKVYYTSFRGDWRQGYKKLSQEFSRTESRILGAFSKLDEFLLNPQVRTRSGIVPGTFLNTNVENQEPNEDRYHDNPHPEFFL